MFQLPSCFRVKHKILKQWLLTAGLISTLPLSLVVDNVSAANLGRINVISTVNQPLKAEIELNGVTKEDLNKVQVKLADDDAYNAAGIKNPGLKDATVEVKTKPNGKPYVEVKSSTPVSKDFLNLMVDVKGTDSRPQTRDYTVMLDPEQKAVEGLELSKRRQARQTTTGGVRRTNPQGNVRVRNGDTLGEIATRMKPRNITVDQMLVMLYDSNPNAFWGKNMNNLKSGVILKVPRGGAPNRAEASRIVEVHANDWHGYRSKVANSVERAKEKHNAPKESATNGQITPKVTDSKQKPSGDQLKLSTGDNQALQSRLQTLEEEATIKEKALKESNERVVQLEKNVAEMKKLLSIQNESMGKMEQEAKKFVEHNKQTPPQPPVLTPKPIEHKVTLKPKEEKHTETPPPNHDDFWSNPAYLAGIVAGLLGIGGLIIFLRKKRAEREEEERQMRLERMSQANRSDQTQEQAMPDPRPASDFSQTLAEANNKVEPEQPVDVLQLVEQLLRDGKDQEAQDLLEKAIAKTPYRNELHLKLLEILMDRRDTDAFEQEAKTLRSLLNNDEHDDWQKAKVMGRKIDPFNPLYTDDVQDDYGTPEEEKLEATQEIEGDFVDLDGDDVPDLTQIEDDEPPAPKVSFEKTEETPKAEEPEFSVDSDEALELPDDDLMLTSELDLSEVSKTESTLEDSSESISSLDQLLSNKDVGDDNIDDTLEALENQGIDIPGFAELGLEDSASTEIKPVTENQAPKVDVKKDEDELSLDSSFDELKHILDPATVEQPTISVDAWRNGIEEAESELSSKPNASVAPSLDDDLNFDSVGTLDDDIPTVSSLNKPEEQPVIKNAIEDDLPDLVLGDLDDEQPKSSSNKQNPLNPDLDFDSNDLQDFDPFNADLELAKTYIGVGGADDIANAKELLNDIIKKGDAKLKAEAEALLKSI